MSTVPCIVSETLDTALGCGFSVSDDYLQLWHCYCDYTRRRVDDWSEGTIYRLGGGQNTNPQSMDYPNGLS